MGFLDSIFGGRKKCPICGMDVTEQSGIKKHGEIFCSQACIEEYENGHKIKGEGSGKNESTKGSSCCSGCCGSGGGGKCR